MKMIFLKASLFALSLSAVMAKGGASASSDYDDGSSLSPSDSGASKTTDDSGTAQKTEVQREEKIPSGSLVYESSTENALSSRIAALIYPGLEDTTDVDKVELRVYQENVEGKEFGSIEINVTNFNQASKYKLALKLTESDVTDANYQMKVCVTKKNKETCSEKSKPSFKIPSGHNSEDLQCTFEDGFRFSTKVPTIKQYANADEFQVVKAYSKSLAAKHGWSRNMELKNLMKENKESSYIYLLPKLDISGLRNFLLRPDDYCSRKYTLVIVGHLLNESHEVVKADRLVAYLPQREALYKKYLGLKLNDCACDAQRWKYDPELKTEEIPIEFEMNVGAPGEIQTSQASKYKIWVTACAVEKDSIASNGAVQCTVPYETQWEPES